MTVENDVHVPPRYRYSKQYHGFQQYGAGLLIPLLRVGQTRLPAHFRIVMFKEVLLVILGALVPMLDEEVKPLHFQLVSPDVADDWEEACEANDASEDVCVAVFVPRILHRVRVLLPFIYTVIGVQVVSIAINFIVNHRDGQPDHWEDGVVNIVLIVALEDQEMIFSFLEQFIDFACFLLTF